MKTYILLLILFVFNTSALISETLAALVKIISPWLLVTIEVAMLVFFYLSNQLKGLKEISEIDLSGIDLFVVSQKDKTQGKP